MVGDVADRPERYVTLDPTRAERVARFINQRMASIPGMNQARLRKESGVSDATLRPLMNGVDRQYWPDKLRLVSAALGWSPDGIERIADGAEPDDVTEDAPSALEDEVSQLRREVAELRELVERMGRPQGDPP